MIRVRNPLVLRALLDGNDLAGHIQWEENDERYGFDPAEWLNEPGNIALRSGEDLAMFDYLGPGAYQGHIWFVSRGSVAEAKARLMLDEMFRLGADTIRGEVPAWRKDVSKFMRRIGFDTEGEAIRPMGKVVCVTINAPSAGDASRQPLVFEALSPTF